MTRQLLHLPMLPFLHPQTALSAYRLRAPHRHVTLLLRAWHTVSPACSHYPSETGKEWALVSGLLTGCHVSSLACSRRPRAAASAETFPESPLGDGGQGTGILCALLLLCPHPYVRTKGPLNPELHGARRSLHAPITRGLFLNAASLYQCISVQSPFLSQLRFALLTPHSLPSDLKFSGWTVPKAQSAVRGVSQGSSGGWEHLRILSQQHLPAH